MTESAASGARCRGRAWALTLVAGVLAAACHGRSDIPVRYGLWARSNEAQYAAVVTFKETLEARSQGRFKVSIYGGNDLGTPSEEMEQLALNAIQFFASGSAGLDELEYLSLPYLLKDVDDYLQIIDGPIGRAWQERLTRQSGVRLVGFLQRGPRQVTANRIIRSLDDVKGLKLRVPELDYYVQTFVALGAKPTPMSFGEVYGALQTGVVDGQENPLETIYAQRYYEVQKSVAIVDYIVKPAYVMVSEPFWQARTAEERQWLLEAQRASEAALAARLPADEGTLVAKMEAAGVVVTHPDKQPFIDATQGVRDRLGQRVWGEEVYRQIVAIGRAPRRTRPPPP